MAKKITIAFSDNPITDNTGFDYNITISGYLLYYTNGESYLEILYNSTPSFDINEIVVGATLEETLQITLSYLRANFANSIIQYYIVGNAIEVIVNADADIELGTGLNDNITLTVTDIEPSGVNLIYYLYFDAYVLNIYKENYLGNATEIFGSFTLKKSSVDSILEPIRGTGLNISLEANQNLTFEEFIISEEFTYKTELVKVKSGEVVFKGYIKPDGCQQSFVNDEWLVNIESVDGLGLLKDLSFVQSNGLQFTGKMSVYDVIKGCLDRTKLFLDINTSVNVIYTGYAGTNILKDIYVNAARFVKNNQDSTIMDCNDVLTSMLNLFSTIITQQDGEWWILRPTDLVLNGYTGFINQNTDVTFTKNLNAVLGSQINNFYPHHADANQQIEVKGAISAYRLNYEYSFLDGFIVNNTLNHDIDLVYTDWTVNGSLSPNILINDPLDLSGALMRSTTLRPQVDPPVLLPPFVPYDFETVLTSDPISVLEDAVLNLKVTLNTTAYQTFFTFKIKTSDNYYLNSSGQWTLTDSYFSGVCGEKKLTGNYSNDFTFKSEPVLNDCTIEVIIGNPYTLATDVGLTEITYIQVTDVTQVNPAIIGEFHTVSRISPPSSITKENQKVLNGDSGTLYIGSIYKDDQLTPTETWTRVDKFESLPLLGISAMDDLRVQSNPIKVFSGSIFGRIPYLSVVTIDNIFGLFMFTEYDYDYKTNLSQVKLIQFYNSDLGDIYYEVSPDYGNSTIKPTIKG